MMFANTMSAVMAPITGTKHTIPFNKTLVNHFTDKDPLQLLAYKDHSIIEIESTSIYGPSAAMPFF